MTTQFHIAQLNIARILYPLDDPRMAGFVNRLDEINMLADDSPGFVWRLQTEEGNATELRPYEDDRILVNMSVWETLDALKEYVYKTAHSEVMRQRRQWFEKFEGQYMVLWWVPAGHIPSVMEAKERLEHLQTHGDAGWAFGWKRPFPPAEYHPQKQSNAGNQ